MKALMPGGIALLLLLEVGPGEDEEVVGDVGERNPALLAVQDVAVAAACTARVWMPRASLPADGSVRP